MPIELVKCGACNKKKKLTCGNCGITKLWFPAEQYNHLSKQYKGLDKAYKELKKTNKAYDKICDNEITKNRAKDTQIKALEIKLSKQK